MLQRAARLRPQEIIRVLMKGLSELKAENLSLKAHVQRLIDKIVDQDAGRNACITQLTDSCDKLQNIKKLLKPWGYWDPEDEGSDTEREVRAAPSASGPD